MTLSSISFSSTTGATQLQQELQEIQKEIAAEQQSKDSAQVKTQTEQELEMELQQVEQAEEQKTQGVSQQQLAAAPGADSTSSPPMGSGSDPIGSVLNAWA
jgi:TolA-binding protein